MDSKVSGYSPPQRTEGASSGSRPQFSSASQSTALDSKVTPGAKSLEGEAGSAQAQAPKPLSRFTVTQVDLSALQLAVGAIDPSAAPDDVVKSFSAIVRKFGARMGTEDLVTGLFQAIEKVFDDEAGKRAESPRQAAMEAAFRSFGVTDATPLRRALMITGRPEQVIAAYLQSQAGGKDGVISDKAWGIALSTLAEAAQEASKGDHWVEAAIDGMCGLRRRIAQQDTLMREISAIQVEPTLRAAGARSLGATAELVLALVSTDLVPRAVVVREVRTALEELSDIAPDQASKLVDRICKRMATHVAQARAVGHAFGAVMDAEAKPGARYEPLTGLLERLCADAAHASIAAFLHGWREGMTERRLASGKETWRPEMIAQVNELTMAALEQALPSGFDGKADAARADVRKQVLTQLAQLSKVHVATSMSSSTSPSTSTSEQSIHMID